MQVMYEKILILDKYLTLASITAGSSCVINIRTVQYNLKHVSIVCLALQTPCHTSVNPVYDTNQRRYAEDKCPKTFSTPIWRARRPGHSFTIMQNFTLIGGTVAEICLHTEKKIITAVLIS